MPQKIVMDNNINKYTQEATSIIGDVAGGLVGGAIAGPAGVIGGLAVSRLLQKVGNEMCQRYLGPREDYRVGTAIGFAGQKIEGLLSQGEIPRSDWFNEDYDIDQKERTPVEEILESFLLKSQREVEEKKLPYMANLLANLCFHSCDLAESHQLIKAAEELSYRQMCLLNVIETKDDLRDQNYRDYNKMTDQLGSLLFEYFNLWNKEYLGIEGIPGVTNINPNRTKIQGLGKQLFGLMELGKIPNEDTDEICRLLS